MQSSSSAFQVYQVSRYGSLLLGAVLMAWLGAEKEEINHFETLLLISGSVTFFWVGGLLDGFLLLYKRNAEGNAFGILRTTQWAVLTLALLSTLAFFLVGYFAYPQLDPGILGIFALYHCLETMSHQFPYQLVATGRSKDLFQFAAVSGLGYVLCIAVPLAAGWGMEGIVPMLLLLVVAKTTWGFQRLANQGYGNQTASESYRALWKISLPLALTTLLSQSAVYVDGFLVETYFPDAFVDFRYGAKEFPLVLLLANSMSIVKAGEIAAAHGTGKLMDAFQDLKKASSRLILSMFPIAIAFLLASGPLFAFVFKGRFPLAVPVFDLFLLLTIPRLMFPQSIIRGYHKTFAMTFSAGVELVINVVLSLILMQYFGIAGIAAATVIAFFAEKIILLTYTQVKLGIGWTRYAPVLQWALGSGLLLALWLVKYLVFPF
ncbi:MAG: polysaccharide biosynthesis C-terminal domain-containing protein [Bacteroidia bacterium]|nr:polysaccharide biosynthesis C-terminal domain-containing protein [Bacteroidia bacterium]